MATVTPPTTSLPLQEHVYLPGVSYSTYERLVSEIESHRRLRVTYYQGTMEIMSPSQKHERGKTLIGRMIETLTEELGIPLLSVGSTRFDDELLDAGLEPDECYYVQHEADVRGKEIKLGEDPPPDLVVEVEITTSVIKRLPISAALGFPEIWQYTNETIVIHLLQNTGQYATAEQSQALPMVPVTRLAEHLQRCDDTDETTWIRAFRQWVRDGMK